MTRQSTVERGAALLDQAMPGWDERIDLERLDLRSSCDCILGQLYGHYMNGILQIKNDGWSFVRFGIDHGFDPGIRFLAVTTARWRRLIEARRTAKGETD